MVESSNGKRSLEGMKQNPEGGVLKNLSENMTSNGLSLRLHGISVTLVPDEYMAAPPLMI